MASKRVSDELDEPLPPLKVPKRHKNERKPRKLEWADIAKVCNRRRPRIGCPLLGLPPEVVDRVLGDNTLVLRDHLSLAGTCRALRRCYTEHVFEALWKGLAAKSYYSLWQDDRIMGRKMDLILSTIWSHSPGVDRPSRTVFAPNTDNWLCTVVRAVNNPLISKTRAKADYKVSDAQLDTIPCSDRRAVAAKAKGPRTAIDSMILYREAAVEALALKAHGGPLGHIAHQKMLEQRAKRVAATRRRNEAEKTRRAAQAADKVPPQPQRQLTGPAIDYDPYGYHPEPQELVRDVIF